MPDERPVGIEERLRSSLRAYADLVEPRREDLPAPSTPAAARPGLRRWRGAVLAAAAAAAVVTGSVWLMRAEGDGPASAGSATAVPRSGAEGPGSDPRVAAGVPAGPEDVLSAPPSPVVGVAYPLDLLTHCGVLGADIGGVWFAAEPPLVEGAANPPPDWGNPYQRGTVTLLSADAAEFGDDAGHRVRLRAADESARPAPCD